MKIKTTELSGAGLLDALNQVVTAVFDNEDSFLAHVYPEGAEHQLLEFYMASERCRVALLTWDGVTYVDTVKTADVMDWYAELGPEVEIPEELS